MIGEDVPFSAADVRLADGRQTVGIVELGMDGVDGVNVLIDNEWFRLIRSVDPFNQFRGWQAFVEDWLPENERSPALNIADAGVFPLRFATRVPYYATSSPIEVTILARGGEETGA